MIQVKLVKCALAYGKAFPKGIAAQRSIECVAWSSELLDAITTKLSVGGQLDRAATSVALAIAEGNGKYPPPDRCRDFEIACGPAL